MISVASRCKRLHLGWGDPRDVEWSYFYSLMGEFHPQVSTQGCTSRVDLRIFVHALSEFRAPFKIW